jgi:hypothetical protein
MMVDIINRVNMKTDSTGRKTNLVSEKENEQNLFEKYSFEFSIDKRF